MSPEGNGQEPEPQQAKVDAATEKSENHQQNEDGYLISPSGVVAIFDGVSTGGNGKDASDAAIESFKGQLTSLGNNQAEIETKMRKMFTEANQDVIRNVENGNTTASAAYIWTAENGERYITIGHVGDTRIYLVAPNGETGIKQLTTDHRDPTQKNLITQYLGNNNLNPQIQTFELPEEAGQIVLTTDGVHDNLSDKKLLDVITTQPKKGFLSRFQTTTTLARRIVDAALKRSKAVGGKIDDITAVVIDIPPAQAAPKQKIVETPIPSVEQKLQVGEKVRVQRTDGTFEDGWSVQEIVRDKNNDEQLARVELISELNTKIKYIPLKKLERLNRPAKFEDIDEAENYEQILDVLHQLDDRNKPDQNIENAISKAIVKLRDPNTQADIFVFRNIEGLDDAQKEMLQKAAIRLAPNMNDLIRILPSAVLGSNGTLYKKTILERMIRSVLKEQKPEHQNDQYFFRNITNTYGIRDAVTKLYKRKF